MKKMRALIVTTALAVVVCVTSVGAEETPRMGGVLKVASIGEMTSKKMRQAFQAALDMEPIMAGAMGHKDFYRLDPGLFFPEQPWHATTSAALYNQRDKDKARRLLKEAGYTGQKLRWATTKEYEFMYKSALVASQQLQEVGIPVDLQVLD